MYYLINTLLVLAMLFFFFLPVTDYRTARMKLWMVCAFAVGADGVGDFVQTRPVGADRGMAGIAGCNAAVTVDDLVGKSPS